MSGGVHSLESYTPAQIGSGIEVYLTLLIGKPFPALRITIPSTRDQRISLLKQRKKDTVHLVSKIISTKFSTQHPFIKYISQNVHREYQLAGESSSVWGVLVGCFCFFIYFN